MGTPEELELQELSDVELAAVVGGIGVDVVISGTGSTTPETIIIGRIVAPLANYIRNPTENLLKELEPLLS